MSNTNDFELCVAGDFSVAIWVFVLEGSKGLMKVVKTTEIEVASLWNLGNVKRFCGCVSIDFHVMLSGFI